MAATSASLFRDRAIWKVARLHKLNYSAVDALYKAHLVCSERLTFCKSDLNLILPAVPRITDRHLAYFKAHSWVEWHSGSGMYQRRYYVLSNEANRLIAAINNMENRLKSTAQWPTRYTKRGRKRKP